MLKKSTVFFIVQVVGQVFAYYLANAAGNPWGTPDYGIWAGVIFMTTVLGGAIYLIGDGK
jgi:hypothetical protein